MRAGECRGDARTARGATGWRRCRSWDRARAVSPDDRGHDAPLPASRSRCVLRPGSVGNADHGAAVVRRVPGRDRTRRAPASPRSPAATSRTSSPGWPPGPGRTRPGSPPATLAHRLGTLRMFFVRIDEWGWDEAPAAGADVPRRPAPPGPPAAQGARRRRRREAAPRRPGRPAAAGPGHRGSVAAHRTAGRRVHRAARRRGRADRRRTLAARAGRQAPRRPLPAAAPTPGHPDRRLPHRARRRRASAAAAPGERPSAGPARGHPDAQQGRRRRRAAAHPPAPAAAHPGHPGHQPRHVAWRRSPRCSATAAWT